MRPASSGKIVATSNTLSLQIVDAARVKRQWPAADHGVAIDLTLDKGTYAAGEDVPLHIALENMSAEVPIYSQSPLWDPHDLVAIEIRKADGEPVSPTCGPLIIGGGPSGLWRYPKGMVVPVEPSLEQQGRLPNYPGVFTVWAVWSPFEGNADTCRLCPFPEPMDQMKPYAVVRSQVRTFRITGSAAPTPPFLPICR